MVSSPKLHIRRISRFVWKQNNKKADIENIAKDYKENFKKNFNTISPVFMKYYIKLIGFFLYVVFLLKISCLTRKLIYDRDVIKKDGRC